jgi:hypothetical protein
LSYTKVYVVSRSNSLWKLNNTEYTTENFTPDENKNIKLETGWILHGADPRQVVKKFSDCFISQDAAEIECKKRNESLGYVSTEKKGKQHNLLKDIRNCKDYINQVCKISYYCTVYDISKSEIIVSNKRFRFIDYIDVFLKIGYFDEPNSLLNVKLTTSLQVNNVNLNYNGYTLTIGNYIIIFIHFLERTENGNMFLIKDIELKDGNYKIIPFER